MRVLYITYDGLTDFIGQSQVLPYLIGSASGGNELTVISFEKGERRDRIGDRIEQACKQAGIRWLPQRFRASPPYLAKYLDMRAMRRAALQAASEQRFDLIHCRSYPATVTGLEVKLRFGLPLLFDMRGFWPDQRREGGRWPDRSPLGRWFYRSWKRHEAELIRCSDHILVLTEAARREVEGWPTYRAQPLSVVPCCTDFDLFTVANPPARRRARERLNINADAPVLAYLGSLGTVYMTAEHLNLFAAICARDPRAKALFIGRNSASEIISIAMRNGITLHPDDIRVVEADRAEVPFWLAAADCGSCFVIPTYSSLGVSPTKLGEYLACGIPVIANHGVGDVDAIIDAVGGGHVLPDFADASLAAAAEEFYRLRSIDRKKLSGKTRPLLGLSNAVDAYLAIYGDPETPVRAVNW